MAETTKHIFATGAETTNLNEWSSSLNFASNSSANVKRGSRSFRCNYNLNANLDVACLMSRDKLSTFRNCSVKVDFRFDVAPTNPCTIFSVGGGDESAIGSTEFKVDLGTDRKLTIFGRSGFIFNTSTGSTVLSTNTYYQIEMRAD